MKRSQPSRVNGESGPPFLIDAGADVSFARDRLGHENIQHTTRYTELSAYRFRNFWERED